MLFTIALVCIDCIVDDSFETLTLKKVSNKSSVRKGNHTKQNG
jgi:hypothetical protein